jgi:hypothetical protein
MNGWTDLLELSILGRRAVSLDISALIIEALEMGPDKKIEIFSEAAITILITFHIFYRDHTPK